MQRRTELQEAVDRFRTATRHQNMPVRRSVPALTAAGDQADVAAMQQRIDDLAERMRRQNRALELLAERVDAYVKRAPVAQPAPPSRPARGVGIGVAVLAAAAAFAVGVWQGDRFLSLTAQVSTTLMGVF